MADLYNLLGDVQSDDEVPAPTVENEDEPWDLEDREQLDLPPALAEAERKQYQPVEKDTKGEEEEEEEVLQEDADYEQLKRLWKQEMNCPELMKYDAETIGLQMELLQGQEETIDKLIEQRENTRMDPALVPLVASIYKMDADRVGFMLTDLTRSRLAKIEEYPLHMREMVDRMSNEEVDYLKQYGELLERHLRRSVLDHLPKEAWKKLDEPEMIDSPNMDQFVFCKVLETVEIDNRDPLGGGDDDDDDFGSSVQEHQAGACLIARYSVIRELVQEGKIELLL